jgi:hypothetical protein
MRSVIRDHGPRYLSFIGPLEERKEQCEKGQFRNYTVMLPLVHSL